jgi:signal transduction protein with GAF and PtsI domain
VATLRQAAGTALPRGAADSAVAYLRRALAEPPSAEDRVDVLMELAAAEALVDGPASVAHLEEAHALADAPEQRVHIAAALGSSLYPPGGPS